MSDVLPSLGLVVLFVVLGGVFAAAEISLVSLRDSQAKGLAERGRRGRVVAQLNQDPNRFLAAVQVGVTLMGFLSAAFGGATLSGHLSPSLQRLGLSEQVAATVALVLVTMGIAYLSLVLGELVPKRLALQRAETFALALGPMIDRISRMSRPVIWLLSRSTDVILRLLGGDPHAQRERITDEELRELVGSHHTLGEEERHIVEEVFEAGDRLIREVMVPRTDVAFLDASMPVSRAARLALTMPHSRYPVTHGSSDDVTGFVHVRDLLDPAMAGGSVRVGELSRTILTLPGTRPILAALNDLRREGIHMARVADEYGGTAGIVTMEDLVEELIGDIRDEYDTDVHQPTRLLTGEVELDGLLNLGDFDDETGIELPEGPYETVAGFLMSRLGRVPQQGDVVHYGLHRITVLVVEGRRVSRIRVDLVPAPDDDLDSDDVHDGDGEHGGDSSREAAAEAAADRTRAVRERLPQQAQ
jgi:putative hemolysin